MSDTTGTPDFLDVTPDTRIRLRGLDGMVEETTGAQLVSKREFTRATQDTAALRQRLAALEEWAPIMQALDEDPDAFWEGLGKTLGRSGQPTSPPPSSEAPTAPDNAELVKLQQHVATLTNIIAQMQGDTVKKSVADEVAALRASNKEITDNDLAIAARMAAERKVSLADALDLYMYRAKVLPELPELRSVAAADRARRERIAAVSSGSPGQRLKPSAPQDSDEFLLDALRKHARKHGLEHRV